MITMLLTMMVTVMSRVAAALVLARVMSRLAAAVVLARVMSRVAAAVVLARVRCAAAVVGPARGLPLVGRRVSAMVVVVVQLAFRVVEPLFAATQACPIALSS